jgi:hypothetical protein
VLLEVRADEPVDLVDALSEVGRSAVISDTLGAARRC